MKDYIVGAATVLILLVPTWPWLLGMLDLGFYVATGQQLTGIPWGGDRGMLGTCVYPFLAGPVAWLALDALHS